MKLFGRKKPVKFSFADYYKEQIERVRRGEPIAWLPGTPEYIVAASKEIDKLNDKLKEQATP